MSSSKKDPVFVVLQLTGGNDYLNTVIPYTDPLYRDNHPTIGIPDEEIIRLDDEFGLHPQMAPIKELWDEGKVAIIHGIGYPNSPRSHFRSMDIWHTCEPDKVGTEGWLGKATKELDPNKENVLTTVNYGAGLPRALAMPGVSVASVSDLATYGLLTSLEEDQRSAALDRFGRMYAPTVGTGYVMDYLSQTGLDALKGADILRTAPGMYSSSVEYAETPIAKKMRDIAQTHLAGFGTRIFYNRSLELRLPRQRSSHAQPAVEGRLGRRFRLLPGPQGARRRRTTSSFSCSPSSAAGSGTTARARTTAPPGQPFVIGDAVVSGHHSEYPSRKAEDLQFGDMVPNLDFRGVYSTILEDWMGVEAKPIVGGDFPRIDFLKK